MIQTTSYRVRLEVLVNLACLVRRASQWWVPPVLRVRPGLLESATTVALDLLEPRGLLELQAPPCTELTNPSPSPALQDLPGLLVSPLG